MPDDECQKLFRQIDERLKHIELALRGDLHELGVISKVAVLWKSWVWILCSASAGVGGIVVFLVERLV